ncbi:peroxidasin homolog [Rhipicephalus microplus]|uniref:peroxidasin homolog n=1 Tax=Rhipicephalus microplus TaxID=6941 RepID=UPI003F6AE3FD
MTEEPHGTSFVGRLFKPLDQGRQILRKKLNTFKSHPAATEPSTATSSGGGVDVSAGSRCPFSSGSHCNASLTSTLPDEKRRRELVDFFESTTLDIIKSVGQEEATEVLESLNRRVIEATHISSLCPRRKLMCHPDLPFRQPDGICNNLENPEWGSAGVCERRILRPDYGDGVSSPRTARSGRPLPSSRLISLLVHDGSGLFREPDERVSQLSIGFGQFLGHDLGFTPFLRLSPLELKMGFREQMNSRTSYADLSAVYGVSKEILETLREFRGGFEEQWIVAVPGGLT